MDGENSAVFTGGYQLIKLLLCVECDMHGNSGMLNRFFFLLYFILLELRLQTPYEASYLELCHVWNSVADALTHKTAVVQAYVNGRFPANSGKLVRKPRELSVFLKFFPESALFVCGVLKRVVCSAVLLQKRERRLLSHAGNARNIVRAIAHKRL